MFALLPLIGGVLLGWLAPRRIAIPAQIALFAIALTMLTLSAPDHGATYSDAFWMGPALALISAGTLLIGFRLAQRKDRKPASL
jgi:peptidoglycan/LPS O-acetylase OafA/YrhL